MVLSSADIFFQNQFVCCCFSQKHFSRLSVESQAVWILMIPDVLSGLIWVQIVCKVYQQTAL